MSLFLPLQIQIPRTEKSQVQSPTALYSPKSPDVISVVIKASLLYTVALFDAAG